MKTNPGRCRIFLSAAAILLFSIFLLCGVNLYAASAVTTQALDLTRPKNNISGDGYYWNNRDSVLELRGIKLETSDEYGIRLMDGATVELFGNNYISATGAALAGLGDLTITGDGTLTVVSDGDGIASYATVAGKEIKVRAGNIDIKAAKNGIRFDNGIISIVDGTIDIAISDSAAGLGIAGRTVQITGGRVDSNSPLSAVRILRIIAANVTAGTGSDKAALLYGDAVTLDKIKLKTGENSNMLAEAETYNGESCISTVSSAYRGGTSVMLGEGFPKYADILLIISSVILLIAIIGLPILIHYRRTKALIKKLEAQKNIRE